MLRPDEEAWERGNREALRRYVELDGEENVVTSNSLVEHRILRGWDLENWMVLRDLDTGQPWSREQQDRVVARIRQSLERIRAEHRAERPTCPDCLDERRN